MYSKLADQIATFLTTMSKNEIVSDICRNDQVIKYGIELLLSSLVNFVLVLIFGSCFFGIWKTIIFILFFCSIRQFSGGFHAKSYISCTLEFLLIFLAIGYVVNYVDQIYWNVIICVLCICFILLTAPIETANKRLGKELKARCRERIRIILCIEGIGIIVFCIISNIDFLQAATMALLIESLLLEAGRIENKRKVKTVC